MAEPILKLTRGVPKTDREWMDVFSKITKHLRVEGDRLVISTPVELPPSAAASVLGRAASTPGAPADIIAGSDGTFLKRVAGVLSFTGIVDSDVPVTIARGSDVVTSISTAIANHELALDPHSQYLTQTEGDARYRELTDAVNYSELTGKPAVLALLYSGTGTPEGAVTAGVGSIFLRTDGGASTTLYVKESGVGNTGWIPK